MSYEKFTTNYHRYVKTPRTWSEARKDSDYANFVTKYDSPFMSDFKRGLEQIIYISLWVCCLAVLLLLVIDL